MIKTECPRCKESFNAPDAYAGKTAQCPTCKYQVTIPIPAPVQLPTNQVMPDKKKQCPKCKEWIDKGATKCPYCRSGQPLSASAKVGCGIILVFILLIVLVASLYDSGGDSGSSSSSRWFQGGNLHNATIKDWKDATYANKLTTAADWLAGTKWKGHLNSPSDFEKLKLKAQMLVKGVDIAVRTADETAIADGRSDLIEKMDSDRVTPIAALLIRGNAELGP